ncbi:MAG: tetraacyldisaccharide 4'-kinase [Pyrinomonadaceae bacterium]
MTATIRKIVGHCGHTDTGRTISDTHPNIVAAITDISLAPLSLIYGVGVRARNAFYDWGLFAVHDVALPSSAWEISPPGNGQNSAGEVGGARGGGDGAVDQVLHSHEGDGRRSRAAERVVVSDGRRLMADALRAGDEPRLLAEELLGVASVIADADRIAAARWAMRNLGSQVFILDDGFQHRRLARRLNLAVIDATNPWSNGWVLPRGRLREPLTALKRADCAVITRAGQSRDLAQLTARVRDYCAPSVPIIASNMEISSVRPLGANDADGAGLDSQQRVGAFCAIGNPQSFFTQLRSRGYQLAYERVFPDHAYYTQRDVDRLGEEAKRRNLSALLTTAKDAVKLGHLCHAVPCFVVNIELEFRPPDREALMNLIAQVVAAGQNNA